MAANTVQPGFGDIDDSVSIATDYAVNSGTLLVLLGGIKGNLNVPVFEFAQVTREFPVKKLFIRDHEQAWYHRGVRGVAEDMEGLAGFLRAQIMEQGCRRVVLLGNSMGGYAAILLGCMMPADYVLAFSPQTFIGRARRLLAGDRRWKRQLARVYATRRANRAHFDLRAVLRSNPHRGEYHLYYAEGHRADRRHALHLRGLPGVVLHPTPTRGHGMVRELRDAGELGAILRRALVADLPETEKLG